MNTATPILIAATFIHVFFVAVLLIVAALYGYYPTVYTTQILYYGQGPQRPHGGAGVALPEVVLRQLPDQMPALVQLHRNGGELLVPLGKDQAGDEDHPAGEEGMELIMTEKDRNWGGLEAYKRQMHENQ